MIQRKQSVYLLIAFIAMVLNFIFPVATFGSGDLQITYYIYKVINSSNATVAIDTMILAPGAAFAGVIALGSLITIFLYRNRILQAKIVRMLVLFMLAHIGLLFFYSIPALETLSDEQVNYDYVGISMPLVAFIMLILAVKGIMSDEKLVRSADRLR